MTMDTETTHGTSQEHHAIGHIVPVRTLFATATLLLILTVVTVAVSKIDFGNFNIWFALGIAVVKGSLVLLFFMHLKYDRPFNGLVFVTSLAFVALFISFALTDTKEYAHQIDTDDAPRVQEKLTKIEP